MLAKKCDRCGKLYEHYGDIDGYGKCNAVKLVYLQANAIEQSCTDAMDLCPECMEEFKNFIKIKLEGD